MNYTVCPPKLIDMKCPSILAEKMLGYFSEKELKLMDELGWLKRNHVWTMM